MTILPCIGIDPDLHTTAIAYVVYQPNSRVPFFLARVGIVEVRKTLKGIDAVIGMAAAFSEEFMDFYNFSPGMVTFIVEGQQLATEPGKRHSRPDDIVHLANAAGGILGALMCFRFGLIRMPKPHEWKGQVPKHIHQVRVLEKLGFDTVIHGKGKSSYAMPIPEQAKAFPNIPTGAWKHVSDAAGLALWGIEEQLKRR